jgi:hypothetical protein
MRFKTTEKVKQLTGTRKREFSLDTTTRPQNTDSYWSGGSRSEFLVHNLDTHANFTPLMGRYPFNEPNNYELNPADVLIETGIFMGKPATPHFLCRPEDLERVKTWLGIQGA